LKNLQKVNFNFSRFDPKSNLVWKNLNLLIFQTQNPWINSKFISTASTKLLLAHMAQDIFFNLQKILFEQPRHRLLLPMVAALLPLPSVWAAKSSPELHPFLSPFHQLSRQVKSSPTHSSSKCKLQSPLSCWLMAARSPPDAQAPIKRHRASLQATFPHSISAFLILSHLLDELRPLSLYFAAARPFLQLPRRASSPVST
jgi:hypothetical protein